MNRFNQERKLHNLLHRLLPSAVLTVCSVLFLWKFSSSVEDTTRAVQKEQLREAILRSAIHCYSVEGAYPSSLSYLKEHYGISWNPDEYTVDYEVFGSNLPPSVTVIARNS